MVLDLNSKLLQVLVVLHVLVYSLADEFRAGFTILLLPLCVFLLISFLRLLLSGCQSTVAYQGIIREHT